MFEKVRNERSLLLLLSLTDPDILGQSKFTDYEIDIIKHLALGKLHRQPILKGHVAKFSLESQIELIYQKTLTMVSIYIFCLINEYISKSEQ